MCTGAELAAVFAAVTKTAAVVGSVAVATSAVKAATADDPGGAFGPSAPLALPVLPPQPILPEPNLIKEEAREDAKKRLRARRAATGILTAPTGLLVEPNIGKPTLLGG